METFGNAKILEKEVSLMKLADGLNAFMDPTPSESNRLGALARQEVNLLGEIGFRQADSHLGNFLVVDDGLQGKCVAMIDFGDVRRIEPMTIVYKSFVARTEDVLKPFRVDASDIQYALDLKRVRKYRAKSTHANRKYNKSAKLTKYSSFDRKFLERL